MTTELPSSLRHYRSELRDAIERDLDRRPRRRGATSGWLRSAVPLRRHRSGSRWRSWAIVGAAAAVLAVTGTLVFGSGATAVSAQTLANRTIKSLDSASDLVEYVHTTMTSSSGEVTRIHEQWDFGLSRRAETFDANGTPVVDASSVWADGQFNTVVVNYTTQTWWQGGGGPFLGPPGPEVASAIEQGLQSGDLAIVGNAIINGQQTIELSASAKSSDGASYDIWVDPTTYLPVQVTDISSAGTAQLEFDWLPATQSNLALLSPPIPSGFAQLSRPSSPSSS